MKWITYLEKKYRRIGIKNLMGYIVGITALLYAFDYFYPSRNLLWFFYLEPHLVLKGEIWRLITFIFIPPGASPIFIAFVLYFYYMIGNALENEWGTFRFNLYYLIGILGTIIASFITGAPMQSIYINLSLFLAFAWLYPNFQILLFFIIPVKMKYLAYLNWFYITFTILFAPLPNKVAAIVAIANYFIFFGEEMINLIKNRKKVQENRKKFGFYDIKKEANKPFHRCTVCGITEQDDLDMQFRYCVDCNGHYGYCMNHLHDHEHIK